MDAIHGTTNANAGLPIRQAGYSAYHPAQASQYAASRSDADVNMRDGGQESLMNTGESWNQTSYDYNANNLQHQGATMEAYGTNLQTGPSYSVHDENANLRAEIQTLRANAEAEQRALDDMTAELMDTQDELESTKTLLARKEADCAGLQARLQLAGAGMPAHGAMAGTMAAATDGKSLEMQQRLSDLVAELRVKDELLKAKEHDLTLRETRWQHRESTLLAELASERAARLQPSQELQQLQGLVSSHEQEKQRLVAQLQDAQAAGAAAVQSEEHTRKIEELQDQVQFFKSNSERVGRQARELKDKNQRLGEDLTVKRRELEDQKSLNLVLKGRAGAA